MNLLQIQPFIASCWSRWGWACSTCTNLSTRVSKAVARLPNIRSYFNHHYADTFYRTRDVLWVNRYWIGGIGLGGYLVWFLQSRLRTFADSSKSSPSKELHPAKSCPKPLPECPRVSLDASLNEANLTIRMQPRMKPIPPKVTLTFCIDVSSSMEAENRETQVKEGVRHIVDNALGIVQQQAGAEIVISMVTFNNKAHIICPPTVVGQQSVRNIKEALGYSSRGVTSIVRGLRKATEQLEVMAKTHQHAKHHLLLLSDGQDSYLSSEMPALQERIKKVEGHLYAIGIGKEHSKETLKVIAL